jgi:hypothetical protein
MLRRSVSALPASYGFRGSVLDGFWWKFLLGIFTRIHRVKEERNILHTIGRQQNE